MKKNLLTLAITSILVLIPFKVSAAGTCTEKTNYYLFHDVISEWNSDVISTCGEGVRIDDCDKTVTVDATVDTAYFKYDIPEDADVVNEKSGWYKLDSSSFGDSSLSIAEYRNRWLNMLINDRVKITDQDDSNINYFLHVSHSTVDRPTTEWRSEAFFMDEDKYALDTYSIDQIITAISFTNRMESFDYRNSSALISIDPVTKSGIKVTEANVNRRYSFTASDLANCTDMSRFETDPEGTNRTCVIPSVYKLTYTTGDCGTNEETATGEVTITYHSNSGNGSKQSVTGLKSGVSYSILGNTNMFTRDGYTFVGWSTNKNATEAESKYNPDSKIVLTSNLNLYAVWQKNGVTGTTNNNKTGLGYSIGIIAGILALTGAGVVYLKKRNRFENI